MPDEKHDSESAQQARPGGRGKRGEPVDTGSKDATLDALRDAYPEELELQGDALRDDARHSGASAEETEQAANKPPPPPRHG